MSCFFSVLLKTSNQGKILIRTQSFLVVIIFMDIYIISNIRFRVKDYEPKIYFLCIKVDLRVNASSEVFMDFAD